MDFPMLLVCDQKVNTVTLVPELPIRAIGDMRLQTTPTDSLTRRSGIIILFIFAFKEIAKQIYIC
jgi:hypothetical protein